MKKLLIAEDDKFLSNAYRVKFTKEGFDLRMAEDGEEVMEVLKTFIPDLILLDLVMPKKNGFATLEELKKSEQFKKIPVVVASNLGQKEDLDQCLRLGAVDYIIKSETPLQNVVAKINHLLDKNASSPAS